MTTFERLVLRALVTLLFRISGSSELVHEIEKELKK